MSFGIRGLGGIRKTALFAAIFMICILLSPSSSIAAPSYDVIVVRGDLPTDYIVASIYASTKKIPLVLVDPDNIQEPVRQELSGFRGRGYQNLLIIGGSSAISGTVESDMRAMGYSVSRLWDWNRYGTAARVSIDLWGESQHVVITNGEDYSGFLVAQLAALDKGAPILFTRNETVPSQTMDALRRLGASTVLLVGPGREIEDELRSMGIAVETVEAVPPGSRQADEVPPPEMLVYYAALAGLLVIVILLSVRFRHRGKVPFFILTEDEEHIVDLLKSHGKIGQNRLAELTDFSKPRISRMIRSLEDRGIITREKYKKTYKIRLKHKMA